LINGGRIVYVGQAKKVTYRIRQHVRDRVKQFDSYSRSPCKRSDLDTLEQAYIYVLQPLFNKVLKASKLTVKTARYLIQHGHDVGEAYDVPINKSTERKFLPRTVAPARGGLRRGSNETAANFALRCSRGYGKLAGTWPQLRARPTTDGR
jgi:hypothetical protein